MELSWLRVVPAGKSRSIPPPYVDATLQGTSVDPGGAIADYYQSSPLIHTRYLCVSDSNPQTLRWRVCFDRRIYIRGDVETDLTDVSGKRIS